jgi:SAM-dependent methyltransferase
MLRLMTECECLTASLLALDDLENYYRWVFEEVHPFYGDRLVEIGAGIGTFTVRLVRSHVSCHPTARLEVFEPEGTLYQHLKKRLETAHPDLLRAGRLRITNGVFRSSPERFDTVIMINVLEHIEDDQTSIRAAYHALVPGGTFAVFVPALPWLFSALDRAVGHYQRYEKKRLEELLRRQGFDVVKSKYMDCLGVLPWYLLNVVGRRTSINPHLARLYDTWFVPVTRWIEGLRDPWCGKNVLVVARKNAAGAS